jgi:sulfatase maturation enzyme AslB (radical SAM superfamily)
MSVETVEKAIRFLYKNAQITGDDCVSITAFGGEPLLNYEGMKKAFEIGHQLDEETGIVFVVTIITNGTIFNDKYEELFTKYKDLCHINVQISVDGIKECHDQNRVTIDGKGTFDKVAEGVKFWQRILGEEGTFNNRLCLHSCLTSDNMMYLFENYKFFVEEWKCPWIWFMPIHSDNGYTIESVRSYKEQLIKIAEVLVNKAIEERDLQYIYSYAPIDKTLMCINGFGAPCGAGKNFVSITASGLISPCHQIYYNDPDNYTIIGNLDDGIDEMKDLLYNDYDGSDMSCATENPTCDCFHCYRCIADNWGRHQNLFQTIRRERCMMSHVERDVQHWVKDRLVEAGLIDENLQPIKDEYENCNVVNVAGHHSTVED